MVVMVEVVVGAVKFEALVEKNPHENLLDVLLVQEELHRLDFSFFFDKTKGKVPSWAIIKRNMQK